MIDARIGLWACSLLLSLASGCSRGKTAESACHDLRDAILEADGMAVYDALQTDPEAAIALGLVLLAVSLTLLTALRGQIGRR